MNEELQKAITELFNSAIQAKDFLVGELPDYINQLLMWKAVASGISMTAFFAFCAAFVWANKKAFDSIKKSGEDDWIPPIVIVDCLIAPIGIISLFSLDWLKILIAPKVYLVEYAATLAK